MCTGYATYTYIHACNIAAAPSSNDLSMLMLPKVSTALTSLLLDIIKAYKKNGDTSKMSAFKDIYKCALEAQSTSCSATVSSNIRGYYVMIDKLSEMVK